jgi:hypothetical protein
MFLRHRGWLSRRAYVLRRCRGGPGLAYSVEAAVARSRAATDPAGIVALGAVPPAMAGAGIPCVASRGRSSVFPRGRPANLLAAMNSTTCAFRSYISSKARPQGAARFAANRNAKTMSRAWRPWRLFLVLATH